MTASHVATYRATGGRLGGNFRGARVLLLDHVGRKSGKQRTSPLLYIEDGDDLVIVASKGGSPKHPAWWINLRSSPETTVQVGSERRGIRAEEAGPEDRARLWPRLVEVYPDYDEYQQQTDRRIPVVLLRRA
jgi:deazaflavin-dependent oxidoreductase (nitroreductase family)